MAWQLVGNIKGPQGISAYQVAVEEGFSGTAEEWLDSLVGADGWSPVFAIVSDSDRRVLQIANWVGGTGTKPATGDYVGSAGLVSDVSLAVDVRGPAGAGSGDMSASTYDPTGIEADAFDRSNHYGSIDAADITGLSDVATSGSYNDLTDKPSLFSGDYDDLTNKPTLGTAAAANSSDFATATQGGKADTALQPSDIGVSVQGYDADTAKLNVDQAWTGAQRPTTPTALAVVSGEIDWTLASGNDFTVMLTANATLNLPSDIATHVGQKGRILITQDGTGGWTFAVDEDIVPLGSEDVPEIPTDPGAMAYLAYDVISATKIVFTLTGVGE